MSVSNSPTLAQSPELLCLRHLQINVSMRFSLLTSALDPTQQQIGNLNLMNIDEMLDSHALWPFTTHAGYSAEQVGWLTEEARREARDPSLRLYIPLYVLGYDVID